MLDSQSTYQLVNTLDNSPRILFWRLDEFLVMVAPALIGVAIDSAILAFSGILLKYLYSQLIRSRPRGVLRHLAYWLLPCEFMRWSKRYERIPPSHLRELLL